MKTLGHRSAHDAAGALGACDGIAALDLVQMARRIRAAFARADQLVPASAARPASAGIARPASAGIALPAPAGVALPAPASIALSAPAVVDAVPAVTADLGLAGDAAAPAAALDAPPPLVARALLARADQALDDPAYGERLAQTAIDILTPWVLEPDGRHLKVLLRGFWHLARGRVRRGAPAAAGAAYRSALLFVAAAPADADEERAALFGAGAQLAWQAARLDDAAGLFVQAARLFAGAAERQGEAACRVQAGFVLVAQGLPAQAAVELSLGHLQIDAELAPALAARAALALAWCNALAGHCQQARERLRAARGLYAAAADAGEEAFRLWWEARIAALDRQYEPAEAMLDRARRALLCTGSLAEAAACSLEQAQLRLRAQHPGRSADLAADLLAAFPGCPAAAARARRLAAIDMDGDAAGDRGAALTVAHRELRVPLGLALPACLAPLAGDAGNVADATHAAPAAHTFNPGYTGAASDAIYAGDQGRQGGQGEQENLEDQRNQRDQSDRRGPRDQKDQREQGEVTSKGDRSPLIADLQLLADRLLVAGRQGLTGGD